MKIRDLMVQTVKTCTPDSDLGRAAQIMWESDCGVVPVVTPDSRVAGVVTDRDVCMAAYTQGLPLRSIRVGSVMTKEVFTCSPEEPLESALRTLETRRARRLPVVDERGKLVGILSLNDLAREAVRARDVGSVTAGDVMAALAAIGRPRVSHVPEQAVLRPSKRPSAETRVGSLAARQADTEC